MSGARPLVAHVTTTDISLELLLGTQLEAFARAGFEVIGVSAPGPYVTALEKRGVRHEPLTHATRSMAPTKDIGAFVELVRIFRRLRPEIVHTHNPKPGVYGRIAARVAAVPVNVNTVHGLYAQSDDRAAKRALVYGLERVAATCSHAELVQNPEDHETLARLRVPAAKLTLLGNGIDLERFDPSAVSVDAAQRARLELGAREPTDVIVGLVGRLVREKGYPEVFEAARRLRVRMPYVRFAVIGGDDAAKSDALSPRDLRSAEAAGVRLLGARDDMVAFYRGMDVYVLASHREGFPRAAMEAAAMGLPAVATDVRGCRQVVDHELTGLLVPARDVTALEAAIAALASDPERRHAMGAAARAKAAKQFDVRRCIDITLSTYHRLLEARGSSRIQTAP
ncbi:MAG: glycosyltransferase family 4 protein [Actinomycetota bacterium]|nr:glycosyltransferase family 4 protein [Actinomycetota bacterium]